MKPMEEIDDIHMRR